MLINVRIKDEIAALKFVLESDSQEQQVHLCKLLEDYQL